MKLALFTVGILSVFLYSASSETLPPEAANLKQSYDSAKRRAIEPLTRKYYEALTNLVEKYTRAGDLDSALAVRKEAERIAADSYQRDLDSPLAGTIWLWHRGQHLFISTDGTAKLVGLPEGPIVSEWREVSPRKIKMRALDKSERNFTLTFEKDYSAAQVESSSSSWVIKRL